MSRRASYTPNKNFNPRSLLTIYSRSGHIVQKYNNIPYSGILSLLKGVEIGSIVVINSEGHILPFNYYPETNMNSELTNRETGEQVDSIVTKGDIEIRGKIVSLDANNVTINTGTEITTLRKYDYISVALTNDFSKPHIYIPGSENLDEITISYLVPNISWTCIGTALIQSASNKITLRLSANILNNTEMNISADTMLVSGDVYQKRSHQNPEYSNMTSARALYVADNVSKISKSSMLEDYKKYNVGNRVIHNKDIAELGSMSFDAIKFYLYQTNDKDTVQYGYLFDAPDFIPYCSVNVYSCDTNDDKVSINAYVGTNTIEEKQKDDQVRLIIGESTILKCETHIVSTESIATEDIIRSLPVSSSQSYMGSGDTSQKWHLLTEDITVSVSNRSNVDVPLIIKHFIGNKYIVKNDCMESDISDGQYIEWKFSVPALLFDAPFTCKVVTASFY